MNPDISDNLSPRRAFLKGFFAVFLITLFVAWGLFSITPGTARANPFIRKNTSPAPQHPDDSLQPASKVSPTPAPGSGVPGTGIMERIIFFQMKLKEKITALIRQAQKTGEIAPLLWVLAAAFVYGMVHSAGPGHGKALALSYIVSIKPTLPKALAFGNILAVSHGMSGVALVFCVKFILQTSISGTLASVTRTTQVASYSLIIILGLFLFLRKLPVWKNFRWKKIKPLSDRSVQDVRTSMDAKSVLPAVFMGMIPCPGVVLAVLFCLSSGLSVLGIMLACAITLGMAATLSLVVLVAMAGKAALLAPLPRRFSFAENAGDILEALAGLILAAISLMLLLTVFKP